MVEEPDAGRLTDDPEPPRDQLDQIVRKRVRKS
jgi:hypothetical protein